MSQGRKKWSRYVGSILAVGSHYENVPPLNAHDLHEELGDLSDTEAEENLGE
jgi:hypothetical protein